MRAVQKLTDDHRQQCLWFLREDFYPATTAEALRILEQIERHGDLEAFRKVAPLKQWLLQNSSAASAA
jgi:uncharacterized protein (DUF3820 family)